MTPAPNREVAVVVADPNRRDGWIVAYRVEVVFDTDNARTRYDHVGTVVHCTCCAEQLAYGSASELARHARRHERELSIGGADGHNFAPNDDTEEVSART